MQQTIWTNRKANMSYYFLPQDVNIYIIWTVEMSAKRRTSWLSWNIHTRNNQWYKTRYAPEQVKQTKATIYIKLCTDHSKCRSIYEMKAWFIRRTDLKKCSAEWSQEMGIDRTLHTTLHVSRINQTYRHREMNKALKLNVKFTYQQYVNRITNVDKLNESSKIKKNNHQLK